MLFDFCEMKMEQFKAKVLVTGGNGFVGSYCILQLLANGYEVKTTLRSLNNRDQVLTQLKTACAVNLNHLTFIEANLTSDDNWEEAVSGCTYVLHVASPFPAGTPKDEDELIVPARDGALRVLRASIKCGVKRVVLTSSFAAIGYSIDPKNHIFTEEDWTDATQNLPVYIKSKTIAERAAWDLVESEGKGLELSVINPVGIFGPVMGPYFSSSIGIIQQLVSGKIPGTPKISFGVVDVRDVADIHVRAMTHPKAAGQRFLATSDGAITFPEIAQLLHNQKNKLYEKVPLKVLPNWLVRFVSIFKPELKQTIPQLGVVKQFSNAKAKNVLGWQPREKTVTIIDTAESLIKFNLV
ncbi:MAG: aldehyde reductase [Bacteroidota bacterium]|nr:aldehyde reductase [Bacteroidota bacterium]